MTETTPAPSTFFPSSTPPYAAAHHQVRGPAGGHLPPPEAQDGFFLCSSLPLSPFPLPSLPPAFFLQVQWLTMPSLRRWQALKEAFCVRWGDDGASVEFGNWAIQRSLEGATGHEERRKIAMFIRGRIVNHTTNCYWYYVLQKALAHLSMAV
ncbi:hypothetical protein B0H14DRAFT_3573003 [Mycena olivaceomarginata]|nr:hypothetical protein B0H14DRAFT_3573003 [Mycena olivaceomarginata]